MAKKQTPEQLIQQATEDLDGARSIEDVIAVKDRYIKFSPAGIAVRRLSAARTGAESRKWHDAIITISRRATDRIKDMI